MTKGAVPGALEEAGPVGRYVMLLAAAGGGPIRGRQELQVMMYQLSEVHGPVGRAARYRAGGLGPHSDAVDEELGRLVQAGMMHDGDSISPTPAGRRAAAEMAAGEDAETMDFLRLGREFVGQLSRDELLTYAYCAYPDMAVRSAEYERLEPERERHVLAMIEGGKISSGRGSELDLVHNRLNCKARRTTLFPPPAARRPGPAGGGPAGAPG